MDGIFIQGVRGRVSANTLREDLGDLIKSYDGTRQMYSQTGTGMQEIYEIPKTGSIIIQTDEFMRLNVNINQIVNNNNDIISRNQTPEINAIVLLMGFQNNEQYSKIYNSIASLQKKYLKDHF